MPRRISSALLTCVAMLIFTGAARSQLVDNYAPPKANCCLQFAAQSLADQLQDWNQIGRYHADDVRLMAIPADPKRVVFMGDSITDGWNLAQYFPGKPYVNRGIGGQTTPQMLVRMYPDVIAFKPAAIIILAGTNDIAGNTGPETLKMITDNFEAMSDLARAHSIKVILCLLTPISDYTKNKQTVHRPPADILKLNDWLRQYAASSNAIIADYFKAVADDKGMLTDGMSNDGLHPNEKGYQLMAPVAEAAIEKALP